MIDKDFNRLCEMVSEMENFKQGNDLYPYDLIENINIYMVWNYSFSLFILV